jgi:hypothetical protein
VSEKENNLGVYCLKGDVVTTQKMSLEGTRFFDDRKQLSSLYDVFDYSSKNDLSFTCKTITSESLPPLTATVCKRKFYAFDTTFCFTFDNIPNFTQALFVNTETGTLNQITYDFPVLETEEGGMLNLGTNSFVTKNYILQIKLVKRQLVFVVKNWQNEEVTSYEVNDDSEITFKNSDIIYENDGVKNRKTSSDTRKLVQRMKQYAPAISCFEQKGKMYVTLGGANKLPANRGAMMMGGQFGLLGALIGIIVEGSSSASSINAYNDYYIVYINCLFDTQFKHIPGPAKSFAFDAMREFVDNNSSKLKVPVIFPLNDYLVLGALVPESGKFCFQNFVNQ